MKNRTLTYILLGLLALSSVSCAKLEARDNLNKGVKAFKDAHYDHAVEFFQKAMELDPTLSMAELYLGTAYAGQFIPGGNSPENQKIGEMAIKTFQNILARDPNNANATAGLASMYQNTNDFQKAHDYYIKGTQLDPTNPTPFYAVGSVDWIIVFDKAAPKPVEEQARLIEEGLQNLDKSILLNPDYDDAMTYKNLLLREKARLATAAKDEAGAAALTKQADEWFEKAMSTRQKNIEKKQSKTGMTGDASKDKKE